MRHFKILGLVLWILIITLSVGCQKDELAMEKNDGNYESEELMDYTPENGGQVILPLTKFNTLNPLMTENSSYYYFSKLIYEGLFEFDKDLNLSNELVESYQVRDEGRTVELKLKGNVSWHDGERFTAEDVEFTINTIKYANFDSTYNKMFSNAMGSFSPRDIRRIMDTSILDENNIVIHFDRAFSNNLEILTFPIIPSHKFVTEKGRNAGFIKALETNDYTPLGTGPYKFENYEKMKQIKLTVNEDYRKGRPYIDEIIGRVLDSEEDILTAFTTGQINMATTIGVDWEKYTQNNGIRTLEFVSNNYEFLGFNFDKEIFTGEVGQAIRKAMVYGINRQSIIERLYLGHGTQIDVPIHPDSWLLSESGHSYGYNLDLAKSEISKLNWKDVNEDGILEDEEGNSLSFDLLTNTYNPLRRKTAEMIKEDLGKIGININIIPEAKKEEDIRVEDIEAQWEEVNEILSRGEYDIAFLGWQLSIIPDLSFLFHSSQIPNSTNFIKYQNENMDELLEQTFLNGNREQKTRSYENLQKLLVDELPYISLLFKNKALLIDGKIMGEINPNFNNPYQGIENCFIPKELQ